MNDNNTDPYDPGVLSPENKAAIHAAIDALPPLSDEQCQAIGEVIVQIRLGNG